MSDNAATGRQGKKKLLVILGAGSSIPCGMPSVTNIDKKMKEWSADQSHFPPIHGNGVFNDLWEITEEYLQQNNSRDRDKTHLGIQVNFEKILGEMIDLAGWVTPSPFGTALRNAVVDGNPGSKFTWSSSMSGQPDQYFHHHIIIEQLKHLIEKLAEYMRQSSIELDMLSPEFSSYKGVFIRLQQEFEVGIYNLNYDNLACTAWPNAYTGFANKQFNAQDIHQRSEWNFIYHLHGSVHYSFPSAPAAPPEWQQNLQNNFQIHQAPRVQQGLNFKPIPVTTLLAGGFKLEQLLHDPFQTFHASLVRHAQEADAFLIVGYGFGDAHVNSALHNRLRHHFNSHTARPPVVILDKTNPSDGTVKDRLGNVIWCYELKGALLCGFPTPTSSVEDLVAQGEFETDQARKVHVWHGGFLKSASLLDQIIRRLSA